MISMDDLDLIKHFNLLQFTVVATVEDICVNFKIYRSLDWENKDKGIIYPVISGHVKYDGCSNWTLASKDGMMWHSCDKKGLLAIGEILGECYEWTKELITMWMGD